MKVIKKNIVKYDVDDTIVLWCKTYTTPKAGAIEFDYYGTKVYLTPHKYHIDLLKSYKGQDYHVHVHSGNGWKWAKHVLETLNLTDYVDVVSTKFIKYVDDLPADEWTKRIYIDTMEKEEVNA